MGSKESLNTLELEAILEKLAEELSHECVADIVFTVYNDRSLLAVSQIAEFLTRLVNSMETAAGYNVSPEIYGYLFQLALDLPSETPKPPVTTSNNSKGVPNKVIEGAEMQIVAGVRQ